MRFLLIQVLAVLLFVFSLVYGQTAPGALSENELKEIRQSLKKDASVQAVLHAVQNNNIKKLAFNRSAIKDLDFYFAHKIETKGITNQKSSGRCWLFTALNTLRPAIIKKYHMKSFEFSENYLFFWDQFEKANLFLEAMIHTGKRPLDDREVEWLFKNPIGDGGVWNMMVDLVTKYGAVPKEAMAETFNSNSTSMLRRLLRRKLREQGLQLRQMVKEGKPIKQIRRQKINQLKDIYRMLVIGLGRPPQTFTWRYEDINGKVSPLKTYTPQTFYQDFVGGGFNDYVMLMNDPSKAFYKLYRIKYDRNRYDGTDWTFVNVPVGELKQFAKKSILNDQPLYFSCDVGKQLNKDDGILALHQYDYASLFGIKFTMNKKQRVLTFDSGSSHGMALMGVDTSADGKTTKWLLENSWGEKAGHKGYLIMTDDWFSAYMFRLVVRKIYVSDAVKRALKLKPITLPPWDAMF